MRSTAISKIAFQAVMIPMTLAAMLFLGFTFSNVNSAQASHCSGGHGDKEESTTGTPKPTTKPTEKDS